MTHFTNLLTAPTTPVVRDDGAHYTASGMRVPPEDVRSRQIAEQAERWIAYADERTRMARRTIVRKALASTAFSIQNGASSLAVPSKLSGTSAHQRALWGLVRGHVRPWVELDLDDAGDGLVVRHGDDALGQIQPKHGGWVRPLVSFGLRVYLARVTGTPYDGYTLGLNVVLGHVGRSLGRLHGALGTAQTRPDEGAGNEPSSGDGAAPEGTHGLLGNVASSEAGGDGVSEGLRLVVSGGVPV